MAIKTRSKTHANPPKTSNPSKTSNPPQSHKVQKSAPPPNSSKKSAAPSPPLPHFLWIPYPVTSDIAQEPNISIDAGNISDRFLEQYPMYDDENMFMIEKNLGKGFANQGLTNDKPYRERRVVHQSVATMQHLRHCFDRDVEFRSWKWLEGQLKVVENSRSGGKRKGGVSKSGSLLTSSKHPRKAQQLAVFDAENDIPCIVFLHSPNDTSPPTVDKYTTIQRQVTQHSDLVRCFPSPSEAAFEKQKVGDIQALDEIAASSPWKYSYRPKTCFEHGDSRHDMGNCCLAGQEQIIMKRNYSSYGEHVELLDGDEASAAHETDAETGYRWFGQELESFFRAFGELRVFVVAREATDGEGVAEIRGRHGEILHTIITDWPEADDAPGTMYARVATACDWRSPHLQPLTASDLEDFSLHAYDGLRQRSDWEENFESLEIGVRLDIGVGIRRGKKGKAEKRFFVNEITRFYHADYFSQATLGSPNQEVCYAFAEAIDGFFS